jgi:hypothetical protein
MVSTEQRQHHQWQQLSPDKLHGFEVMIMQSYISDHELTLSNQIVRFMPARFVRASDA